VSTRVAVLDDYQAVAESIAPWERLTGAEVTFFHDHLSDDDALVERLLAYDIVAVMRERTPLRRPVLERLPRLRLIVTPGMRNASIDMDAARELGVPVSGVGGGATVATMELAWALILGLVRHLPAEDAAVRSGGWQHTIGTDLTGLTLGLLGLGRLGGAMVPVAKAFGMSVLAWSGHLTPERAHERGATYVDKDDLLARSDVVSVHLVLSDRTRGLVGARELALMKPTAYLVNTSRGPIVDESALVEALHAGRLAGAGLDVYDQEPLPPNHPLIRAPRTVLTPHIGFVTHRTYEEWYGGAVDAVAAYLAGTPVDVLNA
jgi:phosphoglycerate dehydrogenase-like enzyme